MKPRLLTADECAQRIGCAAQAVRRLVSEGKLPGAKIAGQWRIDADDLEQFIVSQRPAPYAEHRAALTAATDDPFRDQPDNPFA